MNIEDLTIKQARELATMFGGSQSAPPAISNGMIGKYVIARCRDAGVHAGVLESYNGRECVLSESRRLWYWKAAKGAFLSGVAVHGLSNESKIGDPIRVHLTENCEIIECSDVAQKSIRGAKRYEP
jgi:hypothetical protein